MSPAERTRRYKERHPDRVAKSNEAYQSRNRERLRKDQRERERRRRERIRAEMIEVYGGQCERCGFDDHRALDLGHVNDDGTEDRAALGAGPMTYAMYQQAIRERESGRYALLCCNCNRIQEWERRRRARL